MTTEYENEIEKWNKERLNIENALLWKKIKDLTRKRRKVMEELQKRETEGDVADRIEDSKEGE